MPVIPVFFPPSIYEPLVQRALDTNQNYMDLIVQAVRMWLTPSFEPCGDIDDWKMTSDPDNGRWIIHWTVGNVDHSAYLGDLLAKASLIEQITGHFSPDHIER